MKMASWFTKRIIAALVPLALPKPSTLLSGINMISIVNISDEETPPIGLNEYELRINRKVIVEFKHKRGYGKLAQCLRDAADALDNLDSENECKTFDTLAELAKKLY